jgi:hypothetical protein
MDEHKIELVNRVRDAELVLVGLGEDFQYDWDSLVQDARYQEIEREINDREEFIWIVPFLQKMVLNKERAEKWVAAYSALQSILQDKNYFIVSLCGDDYIYGTELDEHRIVTPCGGFRKMQCNRNCSHILSEIPQDTYDAVIQYYNKELPLEALEEPRCSICGEKLRFNQLGVDQYAEEGYLERWNEYTKWLQGTVNRKLCVLELGVGMEYPNIIRFPFEKIVFYNQKAFIYRVHPLLYQLGEEIADRGQGIHANPVDYMASGTINRKFIS